MFTITTDERTTNKTLVVSDAEATALLTAEAIHLRRGFDEAVQQHRDVSEAAICDALHDQVGELASACWVLNLRVERDAAAARITAAIPDLAPWRVEMFLDFVESAADECECSPCIEAVEATIEERRAPFLLADLRRELSAARDAAIRPDVIEYIEWAERRLSSWLDGIEAEEELPPLAYQVELALDEIRDVVLLGRPPVDRIAFVLRAKAMTSEEILRALEGQGWTPRGVDPLRQVQSHLERRKCRFVQAKGGRYRVRPDFLERESIEAKAVEPPSPPSEKKVVAGITSAEERPQVTSPVGPGPVRATASKTTTSAPPARIADEQLGQHEGGAKPEREPAVSSDLPTATTDSIGVARSQQSLTGSGSTPAKASHTETEIRMKNATKSPSASTKAGTKPVHPKTKTATNQENATSKPAGDAKSGTRNLLLSDLTDRIQVRVSTDGATIDKYADAIEAGADLPPPVVFELPNAALVVADGNHTLDALEKLQRVKVPVPCRVVPGTRLDAVAYAARTNAGHGLPLTNADKRRALTMFFAEPSAKELSDGVIAEKCGVSTSFVAKVRQEVGATTEKRVTKTGRKIGTKNIGTKGATSHGVKSSTPSSPESTSHRGKSRTPLGTKTNSSKPVAPGTADQQPPPTATVPATVDATPVDTIDIDLPEQVAAEAEGPAPAAPSSRNATVAAATSEEEKANATVELLRKITEAALSLQQIYGEIPAVILSRMIAEHVSGGMKIQGNSPLKVADLVEQQARVNAVADAVRYVEERGPGEYHEIPLLKKALGRPKRLTEKDAMQSVKLRSAVAAEIGDDEPLVPKPTPYSEMMDVADLMEAAETTGTGATGTRTNAAGE